MKFIPLIVIVLCFAVFSSYALGFRQRAKACNELYQDSLDTITTQSQTVLADRKGSCTNSFTVITDWDLCLAQAENGSPARLLPWLRPAVSTFMLFFREKKKDIAVLKADHDERCRDYTELIFFPPENP